MGGEGDGPPVGVLQLRVAAELDAELAAGVHVCVFEHLFVFVRARANERVCDIERERERDDESK